MLLPMTSRDAPEEPVPGLDPVAAERCLRFAPQRSPWLHEEVASRMVDRLAFFRQLPTSWIHWQPVLGGLLAHQTLRQRLAGADCFLGGRDASLAQLRTTEAPLATWNPLARHRPQRLALADGGTRVGMLWSNMGLHLEAHPQALLRRWHSHLTDQGFLMFSCLGPDSLRELRTLYARHSWGGPSHPKTDMHDWGDMLVRSGFAQPVMDMERLVLTYSGAEQMVGDLRTWGRNTATERFAGLRTRGWRQAWLAELEAGLPRDAQGRLCLTLELIYGHAFKPEPRASQVSQTGVALQTVRDMLQAIKR